jgi:hypothetical protein
MGPRPRYVVQLSSEEARAPGSDDVAASLARSVDRSDGSFVTDARYIVASFSASGSAGVSSCVGGVGAGRAPPRDVIATARPPARAAGSALLATRHRE